MCGTITREALFRAALPAGTVATDRRDWGGTLSIASFKDTRIASLIMLSGLFAQAAHADEIRHATFPNAMLGTWAETAEQCAAKDKTNIVIESTKYRDGGGDCAVRWIVETAGSGGINYAVHSLCISASLPEKTQTKDIIVRPLGPDRAAMGRSFEDLKDYQRCP